MNNIKDLENKLRAMMVFVGTGSCTTSEMYCHKYNFGSFNRVWNTVTYSYKDSKLTISGRNYSVGFGVPKNKINKIISKRSKCRAEMLKALIDKFMPQVIKIADIRMKQEAINKYLESKGIHNDND